MRVCVTCVCVSIRSTLYTSERVEVFSRRFIIVVFSIFIFIFLYFILVVLAGYPQVDLGVMINPRSRVISL